MQKEKTLWQWFEAQEEKIRNAIDTGEKATLEYIKNQLDEFVLSEGNFAWEIRQDDDQIWHFIISPNGDAELLMKSRTMVEEAPALDHWEFHYAKPPVHWDMQLQLVDEFFNSIALDCSEWKFVVTQQGEKTDFSLYAENLLTLADHMQEEAISKGLITALGEENYIFLVGEVRLQKDKPGDEAIGFSQIGEYV